MLRETKKTLRTKAYSLLSCMDAPERARLSGQISKNLKTLFARYALEDKLLGVFAPIKGEPEWFLEFNPGPWAFPARGKGGEMVFKRCNLEELEVRGDFGPKVSVPPEKFPVVKPEVLLVPGLAFTAEGLRLGRGGGFYDRYCEDFRGPTIGICWEKQIIDFIPREKHDAVMDIVLTDKSTYQGEKIFA